ncbi:MAG: hypothetical protein U9Q03_04980 [Patescibacteria group bacterium]|nr:hypothetical protein [Patescibacteria group bacterium]
MKARSAGQSLLEAIVASGIIVTAVGAALTLVQSSINAAKESDNRLIASNLAREGVEVVRAMRDSNWLAGNDWDQGLEGAGFDYSGVVIFDAATKSWSMDFGAGSLDDVETAVYRQVVTGGPEQPGMFLQGIPQPAGTDTTLFRRITHTRALCSVVAGSTSNFINYELKADGESCATEKIGIDVRSYVRWTSAGGDEREIHVVERMFNWR